MSLNMQRKPKKTKIHFREFSKRINQYTVENNISMNTSKALNLLSDKKTFSQVMNIIMNSSTDLLKEKIQLDWDDILINLGPINVTPKKRVLKNKYFLLMSQVKNTILRHKLMTKSELEEKIKELKSVKFIEWGAILLKNNQIKVEVDEIDATKYDIVITSTKKSCITI